MEHSHTSEYCRHNLLLSLMHCGLLSRIKRCWFDFMCSPAMTMMPNKRVCVCVFLPSVLGASLHLWACVHVPAGVTCIAKTLFTLSNLQEVFRRDQCPKIQDGQMFWLACLGMGDIRMVRCDHSQPWYKVVSGVIGSCLRADTPPPLEDRDRCIFLSIGCVDRVAYVLYGA